MCARDFDLDKDSKIDSTARDILEVKSAAVFQYSIDTPDEFKKGFPKVIKPMGAVYTPRSSA